MSVNGISVMTTIGPQTYAANSAAAYLLATPAPASPKATTDDAASSASDSPAVTVTLSDAAKAAMQAQDDPTDSVAAAARSAIDQLLADAKAKAVMSNGKPTIDMSGMDRRSLYAIASNQGGSFTADEQKLATSAMSNNFQAALAGPVAASRTTGDYAAIYQAGLDYLNQAGPEEKASAGWIQQQAALGMGLLQANATPGVMPTGVANDAVASYVKALGGVAPTTAKSDIDEVSGDARAAVDAQYAKGADVSQLDLSAFDDRSLAAIALDKGNQFSTQEISAAKLEIRGRTSTSLMSDINQSGGSVGGDIITRYAAMSPEERQAQGWTPELYDKMVQTTQLAQKVASMLAGGSSNPYSAGSTGESSLLDYLT
jgi:hypothetical protein